MTSQQLWARRGAEGEPGDAIRGYRQDKTNPIMI